MPMNHVKILSILVSLQRETKPGGFLRGECFDILLNLTGIIGLFEGENALKVDEE